MKKILMKKILMKKILMKKILMKKILLASVLMIASFPGYAPDPARAQDPVCHEGDDRCAACLEQSGSGDGTLHEPEEAAAFDRCMSTSLRLG